MERGLTPRVREVMRGFDGPFGSCDVIDRLNILGYNLPTRVRDVIKQLRKQGEIRSLSHGVYIYVEKKRERTLLDVIWHLIRSHRSFDTDEIERLSGAARFTTLEYLNCLRKLGFIRQVKPGRWQLVNDVGPETPINTARCEELRKSGVRSQESGVRSQEGRHEG